MSASLEAVLRLVAEGKISAEEADGILAAFESERADEAGAPASEPPPRADRGRPRYVRIEITENGHQAVNLRLPTSLGELAMSRIPGIATGELERIREAVRTGLSGPIVVAQDEDGSGVRIVIE